MMQLCAVLCCVMEGSGTYLVRRLYRLGIHFNNQLINQHFEGLHLYTCPHAPSHPACNIHIAHMHKSTYYSMHWSWEEASLHFNERVVSVGTYVSNICRYLISYRYSSLFAAHCKTSAADLLTSLPLTHTYVGPEPC